MGGREKKRERKREREREKEREKFDIESGMRGLEERQTVKREGEGNEKQSEGRNIKGEGSFVMIRINSSALYNNTVITRDWVDSKPHL